MRAASIHLQLGSASSHGACWPTFLVASLFLVPTSCVVKKRCSWTAASILFAASKPFSDGAAPANILSDILRGYSKQPLAHLWKTPCWMLPFGRRACIKCEPRIVDVTSETGISSQASGLALPPPVSSDDQRHTQLQKCRAGNGLRLELRLLCQHCDFARRSNCVHRLGLNELVSLHLECAPTAVGSGVTSHLLLHWADLKVWCSLRCEWVSVWWSPGIASGIDF